ncbi:type III restriction endonuclease subunit R [Lactococcus formosensis]|uniref:DEAD/DEAH box helicase family protein n=1 Tax=Lactococcus formosensis TaxID=1281486 RepID=UPI0024357C8F|nr:DEAD/DEAH box helicase family protein [Lactococcus formosensis]MDG6176397.1 type III restriction endonuclease subunit R [Lactococcus formosensis]
MNLTLRKWQEEAIKRSEQAPKGIFLEALGGRGKTICALAIAKSKKAKKIIITNNRLSILQGWHEAIKIIDFDSSVEFIIKTDKSLQNDIKKGNKLTADVLIIDEWQNMSSDKQTSLYRKIKRNYTIGLSATPIRKKGQNFYALEKTMWGKAEPNTKFSWQKTHGEMVYDPFTYSKEKWKDFRDYERYISELPNFFRWEEIEELEKAKINNGHEIKYFKKKVPVANRKLLDKFKKYNLVSIGGKSAMAKQSFGRKSFERYLKQTKISVEFPKIRPDKGDTPLLLEIDRLLSKAPHHVLVVTKSVDIAELIKSRNPKIGIWTGKEKSNTENNSIVATQQVLGVGVDGLQKQFETLLVLDPVEESSGEYDDYRQLLWRITGSRQQHDVNIVEFYYE